MPLPRPLSKAIQTGIGLSQEWKADKAARKEKEADNATTNTAQADSSTTGTVDPPPPYAQDAKQDASSDDEEMDDEAWAQDLDVAQLEMAPSHGSEAGEFDEKKWMDRFLHAHPAPTTRLVQPLSMPVILPERRPGFKGRGFVRAYAPVLQEAGIDQDTWIELIKGFDQSIANNKWFHVANVAVWVAEKVRFAIQGFSIIANFVVLAVHISVEAGRRGYMNAESNKFMTRMNEEFFKPRGLYAMVIKYDPKSDDPEADVDISAGINQKVAKRDDSERSKWKNIYQGTAGKTKEDEIPDFAPLEFPQLDNLSDGQKENAVKHFGHFLGEYYDRRGQAKFDNANADSKLAGVTGEKQFASIYSDPNHPVQSGRLVETLTGGKHQGPLGRLTNRRGQRRSRLGLSGQTGREKRKQRGIRGGIKSFLKPDTLYLMVVNMPTEEEVDLALQELEEASKQQGMQFDAQAIREKLGYGDSLLGRRRG